jgi:hypothetical protein
MILGKSWNWRKIRLQILIYLIYRTWVSRAIIVTDIPLASADTEAFTAEGLSYSVFPPSSSSGNTDEPIYANHQSQESMACPKGQCK